MELVTADLHGVNGEVFPLLTCSGDLDIASSESFRAALMPLFSGSSPAVVVNLESVPFIDSTGLSVLIACHKAAVAHGCDCRYVINVPKVLRVVEATQVNKFLSIYPSTETAISVI